MTNRAYYLMVIYSAFEFIEELTQETIETLNDNCIKRITNEAENGWYLPSKLLQDFISQEDNLNISVDNSILHQSTSLCREKLRENKSLVVKDDQHQLLNISNKQKNQNKVENQSTFLNCSEIDWNFYNIENEEVEEGFNWEDTENNKLEIKRDNSELIWNELLNSNPFKDTIFKETSTGTSNFHNNQIYRIRRE